MDRSRALFILAIIIMVGGGFRFYQLGEPSMQADHLSFLTFCRQTQNSGELLNRWEKLQGYGHLPFAPVSTKAVIEVFGLELNHFSVRLSSALWGTAAIPAAFLLGLILHSGALGLILAGFTALTPFHIELSRKSYYYAPVVTGAFLALAALFLLLKNIRNIKVTDWRFHLLHLSGFFLLTYTAPSGWSFAALIAITLLIASLWKAIREKKPDF